MFVQLQKEWKGKPAGEKIDVPDEFAPLLFDQKVAVALAGDPLADAMQKALESASSKWAQSMDQVISLALTKFQEAQAQAKKHAVPAIFGDKGEGDPRRCFGDWLAAVARGDRKYLEKHYGSAFVEYGAKAALAEASGVSGGYIVPPEFASQLLALAAEQALIRPRAFVQPMASATFQWPYLDVTTAQAAGTAPWFGGVIMNWTEEAQTRTETEPQFKMLELKAHELSGYAVSSNVLLQDSAFGLESFLQKLFGGAIAFYEDYAFLQGSGVGKPKGIINSGSALQVTRAGGTGTATFQYADAAKMASRLLPSSMGNAIWIFHIYALEKLVQLADGSGRIVWVPNIGGAQEKIPGTLFGRPTLFTEKLPTFGAAGGGDVVLCDPTTYVIGDRMQLEIASSEHVNFLKNQMTWRVVERVDGQSWLEKAITTADGVSQVSNIVVLN
jgi:HK97 family phage major capsid protein